MNQVQYVYKASSWKMSCLLMVIGWIVHCRNLAILKQTTTISLFTFCARSKSPLVERVWNLSFVFQDILKLIRSFFDDWKCLSNLFFISISIKALTLQKKLGKSYMELILLLMSHKMRTLLEHFHCNQHDSIIVCIAT